MAESNANPETLVDIRDDLHQLANLPSSVPLLAPPHVAEWISKFRLEQTSSVNEQSTRRTRRSSTSSNHSSSSSSSGSSAASNPPPGPIPNSIPTSVKYNVKVTRKTTLSILYTYEDPNVFLEYPETSVQGVGYLMRRDPANWRNPTQDFAYSSGKPGGQTKKGEEEKCSLLFDADPSDADVNRVLCTKSHSTCQGVKICPNVDMATVSIPHSSPSRALLQERLRTDLETHAATVSPTRLIFDKTAAFITSIRTLGCGSTESGQSPALAPSEQQHRAFLDKHHGQMQRGYEPPTRRCSGRVSLEYNYQGKPLVVCEFYSPANRFHLCKYLDESYDLDYIEAYFHEDDDELQRIEEAASLLGYGPLAACKNVANFSSQRFHCPFDHRDQDGHLIQLTMQPLGCKTKFTIYEPIEEFRAACPFVLVICKGEHPHPIPLPRKTPPQIKDDVMGLLKSLDGDLADLTPRRFLRHPILHAYLRQRFPAIPNPMLSELHSSLANREHLKTYITSAKVELFPDGTGWKGVKRLKEWQDQHLPATDHYIRRILEFTDVATDEFDDLDSGTLESEDTKILRIIVCMSPSGSRRLKTSPFLQSDIGFKRVEGFHEFEIASMNYPANTSFTFLRIYVNRQTAFAHKLIFDAINQIVQCDTGSTLQWRHLHASSPDETPAGMVWLWTADQHGIGMHLAAIAQTLIGKYDLHDPTRLLSSLTPYEHLHRVFRLCEVHGKRNIRTCAVSEPVRNLMRSLMCMRHPEWDATIASIRQLGGKAGEDWIEDKIRSKFALEGWCWEKSHIPETVWRAGPSHSNLVESVHADVNREGVRCTLLGGLKKGQAFDAQKMKTLELFESYHIRPSHKSGHISENITKSLKRKNTSHHKNLSREDEKISAHNSKVQTAFDLWQQACQKANVARAILTGTNPHTAVYQTRSQELAKLNKARERAEEKYKKQLDGGSALSDSGSGKVAVWAPPA
ncbi:hypothetical protein C8R45DRAFT_1095495 [Mycena sanguinolenta]|nr:hypothetical protein C8R45DRAFT_1095495 [Mycena sanguinolenta]